MITLYMYTMKTKTIHVVQMITTISYLGRPSPDHFPDDAPGRKSVLDLLVLFVLLVVLLVLLVIIFVIPPPLQSLRCNEGVIRERAAELPRHRRPDAIRVRRGFRVREHRRGPEVTNRQPKEMTYR